MEKSEQINDRLVHPVRINSQDEKMRFFETAILDEIKKQALNVNKERDKFSDGRTAGTYRWPKEKIDGKYKEELFGNRQFGIQLGLTELFVLPKEILEEPVRQTRRESALESVVSTFLGMVIAFYAQKILFQAYDIPVSDGVNISILCWMTLLSIVRGYVVRRFWEGRCFLGK